MSQDEGNGVVWVFYLVLVALPATGPEVHVKEPFAYFSSREDCEWFREWWNDRHTRLRATPCELVVEWAAG